MKKQKKALVFLTSFSILLCFSLAACSMPPESTSTPSASVTNTPFPGVLMRGVVLRVIEGTLRPVIDFGEIKDETQGIITNGRVSFNEDCQFWKLVDGVEQEASITDLAVGQKVEIWFTEILESYPWLGRASRVVFISPGSVESNTPMSTFLTPQFEGVITLLEETKNSYYPMQVTFTVNSSPLYPDVNEATLDIGKETLIWEKMGAGYTLLSSTDLAAGLKVTVLLQDKFSEQTEKPDYGTIQEIIILP